MNVSKYFLQGAATIIFNALVFCAIALYNGYPLVTSDSGAYINNGYELYMPLDRPVTYSIFLRLTSLQLSNWLSVFAQSLLLSFLTYRIMKVLMDRQFSNTASVVVTVLTVAFTGVSWYSSQLMPDIFTSCMMLALLLFLIDSAGRLRLLYLFLIVAFALNHSSNLLILFAAGAVITIAAWRGIIPYSWRLSAGLWVASVVCMLFMCVMHFVTGHGFVISRASHVFLMGKMVENGVLKVYLDDQCSTNNFTLCPYKDELPYVAWDFHWQESSPLMRAGGWEATREEYNAIIRETLIHPKYLLLHIWKSIEHTLRQLTQVNVGDGLFPYRENSNPYWKVREHFKHEFAEYMASKQNASLLSFEALNIIYNLILSMLTVLMLVWRKRFGISEIWRNVLILTLLFIVANAWVTATFAEVIARLQSRVVWVWPFLLMVFFCDQVVKKLTLNSDEKSEEFISESPNRKD